MTELAPPAAFIRAVIASPSRPVKASAALAALDERVAMQIARELGPLFDDTPNARARRLRRWAADESIPKRTRNHLAAAADALEAHRERAVIEQQIQALRAKLKELR